MHRPEAIQIRTKAIVIALSLVTAVLALPATAGRTQRTHVDAHGNESGVTVNVTTQGDLANESVSATVPPGGGPSPPGLPSPPSGLGETITETCDDIVQTISGSLQCARIL